MSLEEDDGQTINLNIFDLFKKNIIISNLNSTHVVKLYRSSRGERDTLISLEYYAFKPLNSYLLSLNLFCRKIFCCVFVFVDVFKSYGERASKIMNSGLNTLKYADADKMARAQH